MYERKNEEQLNVDTDWTLRMLFIPIRDSNQKLTEYSSEFILQKLQPH